MAQWRDPRYLKTTQYSDSQNLSARADLHRRFGTTNINWQAWVFDHLALPDTVRILEVGCGPGWLWRQNQARVPEGWRVTLSDLSAGMVDEARGALKDDSRFTCRVVDAQSVPFPAAAFDAIVANHMLYHVPDIEQTINDLHRVLKPGGWLYAATNGEGHMQEMYALVSEFVPGYLPDEQPRFFTLQNGEGQLKPPFALVEMDQVESELHITEVEPLLNYIVSWFTDLEDRDALRDFLEDSMQPTGTIRIQRSSGLFLAQKAR